MSIAADLERATANLAALCRRSFGPCGEETLLFRPPDAPIVTGEGHAVLAALKRGSDAHDPLTTFLLTAADGVHKQLGDASSEFILLVDAVVRHAAEGLRREQDARSSVDRARLSRAFSEFKWELQSEMQKISGLQVTVPVEVDYSTTQPSKQFRETAASVLKAALGGVLGEQAVNFVVELVLKWVFTEPPTKENCGCADRMDKLLFRRVQQYLKFAPDAIIHMAASSVYGSYVVPRDDFVLKKSVVTSQPPGILEWCQGSTRFVCFTCPISLTAGSNHVELAMGEDEELFTAHDAAHLFISKFVRRLRDHLHVQLIVSTEALDESVVAACTRQDIACVQLVEPEDVEALCTTGSIFPLASVFDDIEETKHVGVCTSGVSRARFQQQACLRFRGVTSEQRSRFPQRGLCHHKIIVPQLLIHAPTKGVYKQYYAAIVKSLRVLRSWWEPLESTPTESEHPHTQHQSTVYCCRGGGATELAVARWLQAGSDKVPGDISPRDGVMQSLARQILANALIEVAGILRNNLNSACSSASDEELTSSQPAGNQRHVLLEAFSSLRLQDPQVCRGYTLHYSRAVQTLAGPIQIPQLVIGDPEAYGLIHPWRRIDTLLFLVLQTLEQLFRIDRVFPKTTPAATATTTTN